MKTSRLLMIFCCSLFLFVGMIPVCGAADGKVEEISLLSPEKTGGKPLLESLALRQSNREMKADAISDQDLSNLLWAAWGINRPDGGRTVPTAKGRQNAALFAANEKGVWRYDAAANKLIKAGAIDFASLFPTAPLVLIYAAEEAPFAEMHVGSMYQNAGLYCASAGLANVVKQTGVQELKDTFPLPEGYRIFIVQHVGLPK